MFGSGSAFASQGFGGFGETQAAPPMTAPDAPKKGRIDEKHNCLPVTIRSMEVALEQRADTGEDLKFYGREFSALILVGAVETAMCQGTCLEITLNDGTGRMKARFFFTEEKPKEIVPGQYVSVFGNVRAAPVVHFAMNGIKVVESPDEVSYHMIEVAHAALRLRTQQPTVDPFTPAVKRTSVGGEPIPSPEKMTMTQDAAPASATASATAAATIPEASKPAGPKSGPELRAAVLQILRDAGDSMEGTAITKIVEKVAAPLEEVRKHLTDLVDDGEAYTTLDDDHFSSL